MIEKFVVLPCSVDRAFDLFTKRVDEWWPPERRHLPDHDSVITLTADRMFESSPSGRVVELGIVRCWDAPNRIVLDWYPGTDAEHPTEVEVRFVSVGTSTRIEVRHGPGRAGTELFSSRASRYEASWSLVLAALVRGHMA